MLVATADVSAEESSAAWCWWIAATNLPHGHERELPVGKGMGR
jgi:hypothetical protein